MMRIKCPTIIYSPMIIIYKEDISRDYLDKVSNIREKQEKILDSYVDEMMDVCGTSVIQNLFNN